MRAPLYASTLLVWALLWMLSAGCVGAPTAEDWLTVGFRTPEQTFRTFQTGLRADLGDLEYRCLGSDFKHRIGQQAGGNFSLLGYLEYRDRLFREQPWLKLAAKARVRSVEELPGGRVRLVAEVDTWFHDESFAIEFVREDFWELYDGDKRIADDFAPWHELARERDGQLVVSVPLPEGRGRDGIGELRAGHEFKIDGFSPLGGDATP